jgi:malate dehydrogenase (oxaloacetate-decarboxylating)
MPDVNSSLMLRANVPATTGTFGKVVAAIGEAGGRVGAADIVRSTATEVTRDYHVYVRDAAHAEAVTAAVAALEGVTVESVTSNVLAVHEGGAIGMKTRAPIANRDDLSMAYTPGVARVCMAIHHDFEQAWDYTIKANSVMVVSDGSDVLGLGDIGAEASLPACEAKSLFLRELAGIDAFPLPVDERDPAKIIDTVALCSSVFAGIHLSDISAPRCFEIRDALDERLDIPVFHDDREGTAVAVLAGLMNALAVVGKSLGDVTVAITGQDTPAGAGTAALLTTAGVGTVTDMVAGADVLVRFDRPASAGCLDELADNPIVFNLNGTSVVAQDRAAVYASSLPSAPNQMNSAIAFPGIWKGALSVRASAINHAMLLAAAEAIAALCRDEDGNVSADLVVPSMLSEHLAHDVAAAVRAAAEATGVARIVTPA